MLKIAICAAALSLGATASFAETAKQASPTKMTTAECDALWKKANAGQSGDLANDKAMPYTTDFKKVDSNNDGKLQPSEWTAGCNAGLIKVADTTTPSSPGAPTSDRTPGGATERTPGSSGTGAAGTEAGKTPSGTSDRTPEK